jgi:hypothetical protein
MIFEAPSNEDTETRSRVQIDIDLPVIAVIGSQSAGKVCVRRYIIAFPSDERPCSRPSSSPSLG